MDAQLSPCPFCGEQPEHDYFPVSNYPHELYCDKCIGLVATQKKDFEEAAAAWNRRAPSPVAAQPVAPQVSASQAAWELSTWAATINWDGGSNTQDWLCGLEERIGRVQKLGEPGAPSDPRDTIRDFYTRVCERAEHIMAFTNTVSGAHYLAMQVIMQEMGIEP